MSLHDADRPDSQDAEREETLSAPLIDVVACDGADMSAMVAAVQALGGEVRVSASPDMWFDQLGSRAQTAGQEPADLVVLIGNGDRMVTQRWVARAAAAAPDTRVVAAISEATLDQSMSVSSQGARGLITLPNSAERIEFHLRELIDVAMRRQPQRRAVAKHRQAIATLTAAETDVLDGMLDGMANKQIAQKLSIGLRTVELRRSKIMRKMGAVSLAQLISFICAAREGCA